MKKVININFQGRILPIEESAYEMLQQYIASLRAYFANEEGRDEIINDIENRIAELFGETLKKGAPCITEEHMTKVMNNMGRPQDFDDPLQASADYATGTGAQTAGSQPGYNAPPQQEPEQKRLYRDEQDKILAGVASGLANYLKLDPAIIRIVFALLAIFGGSGFLIYIIMWIVLPSRSLVTNIRKRLYRDADNRVIAGVCGGLSRYFDINPAVPRVIFAAPFIFGIITSIGRHFFDPGPVLFGGFGGGTFILIYIILWIVLPEALTAAEKLEMRGEKVDLNSIRATVMGDMQGFKGRAQKMGEEFSASAQRIGGDIKEGFQSGTANLGPEVRQAARRSTSGLGNALAILIKAFVYFVGAIIAFALFVGLIALLGAGVGVLPLKDFLLNGSTQNALAWGTLVLFLGVPIISLLVWFIRRLMGNRGNSKYIGLGFTAAWLVGLFCFIFLLGSINRSFSSQVSIKNDINLIQPASGKMEVRIAPSNFTFYNGWMDLDGLLSIDRDTMYINTARVNVVKSADSLFHLHVIKISKGQDRQQAQQLAERLEFPIIQKDSILYLPETFKVTKNQKWRNQKVVVVIEVPEGSTIRIDDRVREYEYFSLDMGRRRNWSQDWDGNWDRTENWENDVDMRMTPEGLQWQRFDGDRDYRDNWENENDRLAPPRTEPDVESMPNAVPQPPAMPNDRKTDTIYKYKQTTYRSMPTLNLLPTAPLAKTQQAKQAAFSPLASVMKIF